MPTTLLAPRLSSPNEAPTIAHVPCANMNRVILIWKNLFPMTWKTIPTMSWSRLNIFLVMKPSPRLFYLSSHSPFSSSPFLSSNFLPGRLSPSVSLFSPHRSLSPCTSHTQIPRLFSMLSAPSTDMSLQLTANKLPEEGDWHVMSPLENELADSTLEAQSPRSNKSCELRLPCSSSSLTLRCSGDAASGRRSSFLEDKQVETRDENIPAPRPSSDRISQRKRQQRSMFEILGSQEVCCVRQPLSCMTFACRSWHPCQLYERRSRAITGSIHEA